MAVKAEPLLAVRPMLAEGLANKATGGVKIVGVRVPPTNKSPVVVALPRKKVLPSTANLATGEEVPMPRLPYWSTINIEEPVEEATLRELTPAVPTMANLEAGVDVPMPTVAVPVLAMNKGVRVGVVEVPT